MCNFRSHIESFDAVIQLLAGQFKTRTSCISCFTKIGKTEAPGKQHFNISPLDGDSTPTLVGNYY